MKQKSTLYRSVEFGLAVAMAVFGGSARAHDTWIAAKSSPSGASQTIEMQMTSGERYPHPGSGIAPDRIEKASCLQSGETLGLKVGDRQKDVLHLSVSALDDSNVTCWVQLKPRSLELSEAKVKEYLDEIAAPRAVREAWNNAKRPRKWSETYTKNAKIIIAGKSAGSSLEMTPVGLKLELIAEKIAGDKDTSVSVRVLLDGQPRPGLSIALTPDRAGLIQSQRSNAEGRAVFRDLKAGRWMFSTTDLVTGDASGGKWESQFSTLVFEVD